MDGIGPIDPDLARDLADAAARNPRSTWCVIVTDKHGHAIGHGCARPASPTGRQHRAKRDELAAPGGPDPPGTPRFTFIPAEQPGPPGGYGTWRFSTGIPGVDLLIEIGPLPTGECDHRHEARGHDPGVMLRHLAQVRYATCTGPGCRRPAGRCDFERTTPRTRPAAGPVCVTGTRNAGTIIGSSKTPAGASSSCPTEMSGGPRRRDGSARPNLPGIPSKGSRRWLGIWRAASSNGRHLRYDRS